MLTQKVKLHIVILIFYYKSVDFIDNYLTNVSICNTFDFIFYISSSKLRHLVC